MSWLWQSKIAKSHFYVWYLGSKEADGVRGSAVVLPVMRNLLRESFRKTPTKATVQISSKGLKLIQSVPAMSRSGKVKMQLVKFQIAANCITYSVTGKAPFDDVVGVVMLVLNPEMQSPMHVHCYRCDSPETASVMHANLQLLLSKPETQRSIMDLEQRLFLSGLLVPRRPQSKPPSRVHSFSRDSNPHPKSADTSKLLVDELKHKLSKEEQKERKSKRSSIADLPSLGDGMSKFRLFGDTIRNKTRSVDNLDNVVSTNTRGNDRGLSRISDPFGENYERTNTVEGFWKRRARRTSSIKLDF